MEEKPNYGANDAPNEDSTFGWEDNDEAFEAALNASMDAEKNKENIANRSNWMLPARKRTRLMTVPKKNPCKR
eukprot:9074100-Ditylum_brightwellii.AAC.1